MLRGYIKDTIRWQEDGWERNKASDSAKATADKQEMNKAEGSRLKAELYSIHFAIYNPH